MNMSDRTKILSIFPVKNERLAALISCFEIQNQVLVSSKQMVLGWGFSYSHCDSFSVAAGPCYVAVLNKLSA